VAVIRVVAIGWVSRVLTISSVAAVSPSLTNVRVTLPLPVRTVLTVTSNITIPQGFMVEADTSALRILPVLTFVTIRLIIRVVCFLLSVAV
jgi:hypothetical protein